MDKVYKIKVKGHLDLWLHHAEWGADGCTPKLCFEENDAGWFEKDKADVYKKIIDEMKISAEESELVEVIR